MEKKENDIITVLKELITIPSYNKIGREHKIVEFLRKKFEHCCEKLEIEDKSGNVHFLIGVNSKLKDLEEAILLSGHIDTVNESDGHRCNISIDGENLKGLGISDMKSFLAIIISNIDYLKSLDIPIIISLTSDEETNLNGIKLITHELEIRNVNANMIIVGEPTDLEYYISSRGNSIYVSIMNGISCHSGTPELGVNAIELQYQFISEVMSIKEQYSKDVAVCITHINGGKSPSNVVPEECSICFGIRASNSKVIDIIQKHLLTKHAEISKQYGESKLFNVLAIPPFDSKESEFLSKNANSNGKQLIDAKFATEAGYFQELFPDADIVIYGPGNPNGIHSNKEMIKLNNLFNYETELKELLDSYLKYKRGQGKKLVKKLKLD